MQDPAYRLFNRNPPEKRECRGESRRLSPIQSTRIDLAFIVIGIVLAGTAAAVAGEPDAALRAEAKVGQSDATTAALAKVPGGTVRSVELERERGMVIWSFDITRNQARTASGQLGRRVAIAAYYSERIRGERVADAVRRFFD